MIAPATGKLIGEIAETPIGQVDSFYQKGKGAFKQWSKLTVSERASYLLRLKEIIVEQMEEIAKIIAEDTGKVVTEALVADIMPTLDAIDHTVKHGKKRLQTPKSKNPPIIDW